ncbi:MAG: RiPP maturation radical SAM C-methyltransferase [Candidatus Thiodiazotropha endolucinida]
MPVPYIVIVQPPWGSPYIPAFGAHILQRYIKDNSSAECIVTYSNFDFYESLPSEFNNHILRKYFWENPKYFWLPEGLFAPYIHQDTSNRDRIINAYFNEIERQTNNKAITGIMPRELQRWLKVSKNAICAVQRELVPNYLLTTAKYLLELRPSIIGFTCLFNQITPALALAKAIKDQNSKPFTVLGGASIHEEAAEVLTKRFHDIDFAVSGDGEIAFLALCNSITDNGNFQSLLGFQNLFSRHISTNQWKKNHYSNFTQTITRYNHKGTTFVDQHSKYQKSKVRHLKKKDRQNVYNSDKNGATHPYLTPLTPKDFHAFIERHTNSSLHNKLMFIPFEASRGCYWMYKSKCIFCGISDNFPYRIKRPEDLKQEIQDLVKSISADYFVCVDSAFPKSYISKVFPDIFNGIDVPPKSRFYFEVRADLTKEDLSILSRLCSITIQPGIESFSTSTLKKMRKGTSSLINIQLLKWCLELEIYPEYNILYDLPGEIIEDYTSCNKLIPLVVHLQPPYSISSIALFRHSPMWRELTPEYTDCIPRPEYSLLYPMLSQQDIWDLAYYFKSNNIKQSREPSEHKEYLINLLNRWKASKSQRNVHLMHGISEEGNIWIYDSRELVFSNNPAKLIIIRDRLMKTLFLALDKISTMREICTFVNALDDYPPADEEKIQSCLAILERHNLVVTESDTWLCLSAKTDKIYKLWDNGAIRIEL